MHTIDDYRAVVGDAVIAEMYRLARRIYGAKVLHINSTYYGGGVAEMLMSLIPLLNEVGIEADWRTVRGEPEFFGITKSFHNGIQGASVSLDGDRLKVYEDVNQRFSRYCKIEHDLVVIHDPQPLPLINYYKKKQPWVWRCHVDLSHPDPNLWQYLRGFIIKYDQLVISHESYLQKDMTVDHRVLHPAIDPLTSKNAPLSQEAIDETLARCSVPTDKPLVTQISRFDKWKDPLSVLEGFKRVKERVDCRLILCGSMAPDDPEGMEIYESVRSAAGPLIDTRDVILLTIDDNLLVNALQRVSAVIVQKSLREGFGLTVSEALWKGTPVVATNVGGIPLQISDGHNGFLVEPNDLDAFVHRVVQLLKDRKTAAAMGAQGKDTVLRSFLITRYAMDHLRLIRDMLT